jgi:hypothetical protein
MRITLPSVRRLVLLIFVVVPVMAWAIVKPVRVIAPSVGGARCVSESVCIDDVSKLSEANRLYSEAIAFVSSTISPVQGHPKVIFCASQACADAFGLGRRSAMTVGNVGVVIGPRAWHDYYVRHEIIHYLQGQQLGMIARFTKPDWLVEGMAYGLSQDPRTPLAEPFEAYRAQFMAWYAGIDKASLWQAAARL